MAVMFLLAAAHVSFWSWGLALGLASGTLDLANGIALTVWLAGIGLWLAVFAQLSRSGWLTGSGVMIQPWLWVPLPTVLLSLIGILFVPALRDAWFGALAVLPAVAVPALNGLRILAVGTKAWRGRLPRRIGSGVGIADMTFGVWFMGIAVPGGFSDPRAAIVWYLTGAAFLLLMLPMVFAALRPPRLDAPGKGDSRAILKYPLIMAPAGLATLFLIWHALALLLAGQTQVLPCKPKHVACRLTLRVVFSASVIFTHRGSVGPVS
jgi:hypothetical protein